MKINTTRQQRGLYLAASATITDHSRGRYQVNSQTVSINLRRCTCYDAKHNKCKHQIAAEVIHQHGRLSVSLAMIMAAGGGQLIQTHKGGIGKYWRLENNDLIGQPLPVEWKTGSDNTERLYPAQIVDAGIGYELIPLTNAALAKDFAPALYEKCKLSSVTFLHAALSDHEKRSQAAKQCQQQPKRLRKAA